MFCRTLCFIFVLFKPLICVYSQIISNSQTLENFRRNDEKLFYLTATGDRKLFYHHATVPREIEQLTDDKKLSYHQTVPHNLKTLFHQTNVPHEAMLLTGDTKLTFYQIVPRETQLSSDEKKLLFRQTVSQDVKTLFDPTNVPDKVKLLSDDRKLSLQQSIPYNLPSRGVSGNSRLKRGIVIIDEDFDTFPEAGVRQSWSDGNSEVFERDVIEKENENVTFTEEGSGRTLFEGSTMKLVDTPGELQMTKERPKSSTPLELDDGMEGSGEDVPTPVPTAQVKDLDVISDALLESCLNTTCDSKLVTIQPGFVETVPEDTSLMLSCSMTNFTVGETIRWYRRNGSDEFLLPVSFANHQLTFAIPTAKVDDSGSYVCVRLIGEVCCHQQVNVTVYKKPNYTYHMLIVGLVALVSLLTCMLLGIHRRYKLKQIEKEIKIRSQIPLNEFLL